MALTFKTKGSDFKRLPAGTHIAVCDIVAALGLQETFFGAKQQVYIRFNVPDQRWKYEKDGEQREGPGVIGNFYTGSMSKKANLRKILEGWRSKAFTEQEAAVFDIFSVLGKACMVNVTESTSDGTTYSNIASISPLPKSVPVPTSELPLLCYSENDKRDYEKLPEWIRKKIDTAIPEPDADDVPSVDYSQEGTVITDDDIPF